LIIDLGFDAQACTNLFIVALQFLCNAPKSGAGLRIEYKFIIQSKQCIEKSLTNQK
jgi:hypothetical protein